MIARRPDAVKTLLLSLVQKIPDRIGSLSCSEKRLLLTKVETFKSQTLSLLSGGKIQSSVGSELLRIADLP
jgi:hypothetical protein